MAAVPVTIDGVLFDKYGRTTQLVRLMGEATITGLGVGGGPMPPGEEKPPGQPPGIWGGPIDPYPDHGLPPWWAGRPPGGGKPPGSPPGIWGGPIDPYPGHPLPEPPLPPNVTPPQPGEPPVPLPPPQGAGGWPVQPIQPPAYIVVNYPGVGPIIVAPPAHEGAEPK